MILWILTITMLRGSTVYGYKFVDKTNCEKIGKDLTKSLKYSNFTCKKKQYVIQ